MITLEAAKLALSLDGSERDSQIQNLIDAATKWVERVTGSEFGENPPEDLKLVVTMLVCHWFDKEGDAGIPQAVEVLIAPHRSFAHSTEPKS